MSIERTKEDQDRFHADMARIASLPVTKAIKAMERKPTAAAMRAADFVWKEEVSDVGLCPRLEKQRRIAEIIDRETGLPELIAACKAACEAASDCLPISGENPRVDVLYYKAKLMAIDAAAAKCSAAILKAEGRS